MIKRGPPKPVRYRARYDDDGSVTYEEDKQAAGLQLVTSPAVFVPVPQLKEAVEIKWQQQQQHLRWKM